MKEKWKELIGKRILLRKKHVTTTSVVEATVVEVSESGKFVKFKWRHGGESWEVPEDEYSFSYDKILEVLGQAKEIEAERKSEEEKAYTQNMRERAQVAANKEKKEQIMDKGGIYEILKPNECYLITKIDDRLVVANNKDGKIEVEYVSLAHEEDAMAAIHAIGAGRAIGAGINTLLKMLSEQEEKKLSITVKGGEEKKDDTIR